MIEIYQEWRLVRKLAKFNKLIKAGQDSFWSSSNNDEGGVQDLKFLLWLNTKRDEKLVFRFLRWFGYKYDWDTYRDTMREVLEMAVGDEYLEYTVKYDIGGKIMITFKGKKFSHFTDLIQKLGELYDRVWYLLAILATFLITLKWEGIWNLIKPQLYS